MLSFVVLAFIFLFLCWRKTKDYSNYPPGKRRKILPAGLEFRCLFYCTGPRSLPILGSIPFVPRKFRIAGRGLHTPKLFYYLAQKYGDVCHLWLGPVPTILISDAKILKEAFKHPNLAFRPIMKPFHEFRYGSPVRFQIFFFHKLGFHSEIR